MNQSTLDTLTQRLDRMEREVRWWRLLGVAGLASVSLALLLGATGQKVADEVRAKRFVVVDEQGSVRGELGIDGAAAASAKSVAVLRLYDESGAVRVLLYEESLRLTRGRRSMSLSPSFFMLSGEYGTASLSEYALVLNGRGNSARLWLEDAGEAYLEMRAAPPGHAWMWVGDTLTRNGILLSGMPARGTPVLRALDGLQAPMLSLMQDGTSRAVLGRIDLERRATGVVEQRPASSLVLFGNDGEVIWKAP